MNIGYLYLGVPTVIIIIRIAIIENINMRLVPSVNNLFLKILYIPNVIKTSMK